LKVSLPQQRILDFDIENRPLSYLGGDFTTAEITAIAWGWTDSKDVEVRLLGEVDYETMLTDFVKAYDEADIVTGHYIRNHDLPHINGALLESGFAPLSAKRTSCTKNDLVRRTGVSASQESLADMLGVKSSKEHMTQRDWRTANRLLPKGLERTKTRVVNDVIQHKQLRERLIEEGYLRPPKVWKP
jgi:hypothetical protein